MVKVKVGLFRRMPGPYSGQVRRLNAGAPAPIDSLETATGEPHMPGVGDISFGQSRRMPTRSSPRAAEYGGLTIGGGWCLIFVHQ